MKYNFLIIILSFTIPFSNLFSSTEVVIYSDDAYFPYSFTNSNGKAAGVYVKIIEKAFESMPEYNLKIIPLPWKRALNALEKNEVLAVFPPYYRPKERPYIGIYSEPLCTEKIVAVTRKGENKTGRKNWPSDWLDKRIGLYLGTIDIAGPELAKAVKDNKAIIIETVGNDENLLLLAKGKIDIYVNDRTAINKTIKNLKSSGQWLKTYPEIEEVATVSIDEGYLAFSNNSAKFPFKNDLIKKFNIAIKNLKKTNKLKDIIEKELN